ncbi:MAG: hypothetical protein ACYCZP_06810, partial [Acidimicrobiales bacterium]
MRAPRRHALADPTSRARSTLQRWGAVIAGVALAATACGAGLGQPVASASAKAHHSLKAAASPRASKSPKAASGGVPAYALAVGEIFTWILPLEPTSAYEDWDSNIEGDMWLPLYWAGKGSKTGIDYTQSIGKPPVYSNHDTTVTVTMKTNFKWSTGATVTSNDVRFF